jgi:gamma-glutamylcyclotransferase (GGCT)/AIG2-like uncharacterized protein YtfP
MTDDKYRAFHEKSAVPDLLAVYGTLRRRDLWRNLPRAAPKLHFLGSGLIRGRLFWQGRFPALVREYGITNVEVYRVIDPSVWLDLDAYEGFCPERPASSLFQREPVRLFLSGWLVWVYALNPAIPKGAQLGCISHESTAQAIGGSASVSNAG